MSVLIYITFIIILTFVILITVINWRFYRYPMLLIALGVVTSGISLFIGDFLQLLQIAKVANFDVLHKLVEYTFLAAGGGVIASAIVLKAEQSYRMTQSSLTKEKAVAQEGLNDCYQKMEALKSQKLELDEKTYNEKLSAVVDLCMHFNDELKKTKTGLSKLELK